MLEENENRVKGSRVMGKGLLLLQSQGSPLWGDDAEAEITLCNCIFILTPTGWWSQVMFLGLYIYILRLVSFNQDSSGKLHFIWKTKLAFSHRNMLDIFRNMLVGLSSELSRGRVTSLNTAPHFTWQVIIIIANRYWALIMSCVRHESMCFTCIISFSADNHSEADYLSQL